MGAFSIFISIDRRRLAGHIDRGLGGASRGRSIPAGVPTRTRRAHDRDLYSELALQLTPRSSLLMKHTHIVTVGNGALRSILSIAGAADMPRATEITAVNVEPCPGVYALFVGEGKSVTLSPIRSLVGTVGPPVRPVALLTRRSRGQLTSGSFALAAVHIDILTANPFFEPSAAGTNS